MKRDTPITPEMADQARETVNRALARGLKAIADPVARADYLQGADVVRDLIGTQLDIRSGQRGRTQAERAQGNNQSNALASNRIGGQAIGPEVEPTVPTRQIASGLTPPNAPTRVTRTEADRSEPARPRASRPGRGKVEGTADLARASTKTERTQAEQKVPDAKGRDRKDRGDRSR